MTKKKKKALPSMSNSTIHSEDSSAQSRPTVTSNPGLSARERKVLEDRDTQQDEPVASASLVVGFDLASIRLVNVVENPVEVERVITRIPIKKPAKDAFIRCHPDVSYELPILSIENRTDNEFHVVSPLLRDALATEPMCVVRVLVPYITRGGELFVWPIRLPGSDGKIDDYNQSAREHSERARRSWVRVTANRELGCYDVLEARGDLTEPNWPPMEAEELYGIALRDRVITAMDHPVLRKLRGEV